MKKITIFAKLFDFLLDIGLWIAMILSALIAIFLFVDVIFRYFFGHSIGPIIDIITLFLVYIPFLAGGWLLKKDGHVNVNIYLMGLSEKQKGIITGITSCFGIVISAVLLWYGVLVTINLFVRDVRTIEVLATPLWIYTASIPLGGVFLLVQFCRRTVENFKLIK